jgi:hypothetical protein
MNMTGLRAGIGVGARSIRASVLVGVRRSSKCIRVLRVRIMALITEYVTSGTWLEWNGDGEGWGNTSASGMASTWRQRLAIPYSCTVHLHERRGR